MSRKFQLTSPRRIPLRRKQITPMLKEALEKGGVIKKWGKKDICLRTKQLTVKPTILTVA